MPTITVENLPTGVHQLLTQMAALHQRSLNHEIIVRLEHSFKMQKPNITELIAEARALRNCMKGHLVTDAELFQAKTEGRL